MEEVLYLKIDCERGESVACMVPGSISKKAERVSIPAGVIPGLDCLHVEVPSFSCIHVEEAGIIPCFLPLRVPMGQWQQIIVLFIYSLHIIPNTSKMSSANPSTRRSSRKRTKERDFDNGGWIEVQPLMNVKWWESTLH